MPPGSPGQGSLFDSRPDRPSQDAGSADLRGFAGLSRRAARFERGVSALVFSVRHPFQSVRASHLRFMNRSTHKVAAIGYRQRAKNKLGIARPPSAGAALSAVQPFTYLLHLTRGEP